MGKRVIIGGLSQSEVCERLGTSKWTIAKWRKAPDWPGDDAAFEEIEAYCQIKKEPRGRKAKPKLVESDSGDSGLSEEMRKLRELDYEGKAVVIEKNKAQIAKYQKACLEQYRREIIGKINGGLDQLFSEITRMNFTPEQIRQLSKALKSCQKRIENV